MDPIAQNAAIHAFHWLDFLEGLATLFFAGLAAYIPWIQWKERKRKEKIEEQNKSLRAQWEAEQARKTRFVTEEKFNDFDKKNEEAHTAVKKMVGEAILEFGEVHDAVNKLSVQVGTLQGGVDTLIKLAQNGNKS